LKVEIEEEEVALIGLILFIGLAYWFSLPKTTRKKVVKILQEDRKEVLKKLREVKQRSLKK
jgi:hypothetical protein